MTRELVPPAAVLSLSEVANWERTLLPERRKADGSPHFGGKAKLIGSWMLQVHGSFSFHSALQNSCVFDIGAGNAFLGGLAAGLHHTGGDVSKGEVILKASSI